MAKRKGKLKNILALALATAIGLGNGLAAFAQDSSGAGLSLYINPRTKVVYSEPGPGRRLLTTIPMSTVNSNAVLQQTQAQLKKNQEQIQELEQKNQQLEVSNQDLTQQIAEIKPAWRSYIENFQDKFRVGALVYGDYRFYTHTSFQPQELTQITNPGPWNNNWNSFDISRTYLNFYFFPTKDWMMRLTPNIYKTIGSSNDKVGQNSAWGSNLDGNLGMRMKYAQLQYSGLWDKILDVPMLKGGTVSMGEIPNPLVGWEEDLWGFRYVALTPWNYLSLSSTQLGVSMEGPIRPFGGEKTYLDYGLGVYNNGSFHAFENTDEKQVMGRLSFYPFGADWRFQGLGITGFYDYGYGNTLPDTASVPSQLKGPDAHITRIAALLHYTAEQWGLAGEFDYGNNAFSAGNLFSGSGPGDEFGFVTGTPSKTPIPQNPNCTATVPCYNPTSGFGAQTGAWNALLNNGQTRQIGFDMFGHYHIPYTKLTAFGMFEWFQPNDKVATDPLDFQRFIVGVSYQVNEFLRFAVDSQNFLFYHNNMSLPVSYLEKFDYAPGAKLNGQLLPSTGSIPNLVPFDTHSVFLNMEFNY